MLTDVHFYHLYSQTGPLQDHIPDASDLEMEAAPVLWRAALSGAVSWAMGAGPGAAPAGHWSAAEAAAAGPALSHLDALQGHMDGPRPVLQISSILTSCMHKIPRKHSQQLTGDGDGAQENISTLQTTADAALALAHGQRSLQGVACVRLTMLKSLRSLERDSGK